MTTVTLTKTTTEETYIGEQVTEGKEVLTKKVFKDMEKLFNKHNFVYIKEYGEARDTMAKITYVGHRFTTVELPNGYRVSINYGSILDNQNQKGESVSQIKFV